MLVRVDGEAIWLHIKRKALALALGTGFDGELDSAWDLVWISDLESLASAVWVLRCDESTKPEEILLDRENT